MTVAICEVGPRDGLQNEDRVLEPELRIELVRRLVHCGVRRIEATSFINPARVPAMADAEAVVEGIDRVPGVVYAGLVLNERGYDRLLATGLDEARMVVASTESFSERNANCSVETAVRSAGEIVRRARADGIRVSVTLAVAFGCPFEGKTPESRVVEIAEALHGFGPDELILADTIGVAAPAEVRRLVSGVASLGSPVGVHLHDTRNTGIVNSYAAIESGAVVLDAAVGGTGGCPFAPGAAGNVATEDLVYALERDGIDTGIDLAGLRDVAQWLEGLLGHALSGHLYRVQT